MPQGEEQLRGGQDRPKRETATAELAVTSPQGDTAAVKPEETAEPANAETPTTRAFLAAARKLGIKQPATAGAPTQIGESDRFFNLFLTPGGVHLVVVQSNNAGVLGLGSASLFSMDEAYAAGAVAAGNGFNEAYEPRAGEDVPPRMYMAAEPITVGDLDGDGRQEAAVKVRAAWMCCGIGPLETKHHVVIDLETLQVELTALREVRSGSYRTKSALAWEDTNADGRPDLQLTETTTEEDSSEKPTVVEYTAVYDSHTDLFVGKLPSHEESDFCCPADE